MGRKPKPATLLMRQGTYRPGRHEVQPRAVGDLAKPRDLGKFGSKLWDGVIDFIEQQAGAGECDTECVAGMCRWYNEYRRLAEAVAALPPTDEDHRTLLYSAATAWRSFIDMASRFGITPADRARLKHSAEEHKTTLDKLLSNRKA
jgi:phage terminase small subunit